jgi:hypothetical protein
MTLMLLWEEHRTEHADAQVIPPPNDRRWK